MSKLIIIIILTGLLTAFCYFLAWPQYKVLTELKSQILSKQEELYSKEEYISRLAALSGELKNHQQAVDKINYAFPDEADVPEILVFLEQTASVNGLIIEEINVGAKPKTSPASSAESKVRERGLEISFSGEVESLINFLAEVEQSARLLQIGSLSFEYIEDDLNAAAGVFSFEISFKIRSWSDELAGGGEEEGGELLSLPLEPKEISVDFEFLSSPELDGLKIPEQVILPEEFGRENPFISY